MQNLLSELVDYTSEIFNNIECKSCIEKIKINSECCSVGLKDNRLIYKCKECKEEWKRPINQLKKKFPSIYHFCDSDLNKFVLLLRKGVYLFKVIHYYFLIYLKILEICVLVYMNLTVYILYLHLD